MEDTALAEYSEARLRFARTATVISAGSIALAGASRIPLLQLSSPLDWIQGSVNIGFLPIFGPVLILGGACHLYCEASKLIALRVAATKEPTAKTPLGHAVIGPSKARLNRDRRRARASWGLRSWYFAVPVLAYVILLSTYFDFVRPTKPGEEKPGAYADLLLGTGGLAGFPALLPTVRDNIEVVATRFEVAGEGEAAARARQAAEAFPWIYPPFQTWAYLIGLVLTIDFMYGTSRLARRET